MSGKSHFILQLLQRANEFLTPVPTRIVYAFGAWQDAFEDMEGVEFVDGVEGLKGITFDKTQNNLLILDDLMEELSSNKQMSTLFTKDMHHKNVSVIFIVQNLFKQGRSMRDVTLNCNLFVLFKSPRDVQQIKVMARQMDIPGLDEAYKMAIKQRYGHLVINLQPHVPDILRLQGNILAPHRQVFRP